MATPKYLGTEIIPILKKKFDAKLDTSTYEGELEQLVSYLRAKTSSGGWALDSTERLSGGLMVVLALATNANGTSIAMPTEPFNNYDMPFAVQAARIAQAFSTKTATPPYHKFRRLQADGTTKIDTSWQECDAGTVVTISDKQWVEIQIGATNETDYTVGFSVAPYWTPGLVPELETFPKLYNIGYSAGEYWPFSEPLYQNDYQFVGNYTNASSNFYYRMLFQVDASACANETGLLTIFGLIKGVSTTTNNAWVNGFGLNLRIV